MKQCLVFLAMLGLIVAVNGAALATDITLDGDYSEWDPNRVHSDAAQDVDGWDVQGELLTWGVEYQAYTKTDPGYLYWFCEMNKEIALYNVDDNSTYPGLWIDVDHYSGPVTYLANQPYRIKPNGRTDLRDCYMGPSLGNLGNTWCDATWQNGVHQGIDICAELGLGPSDDEAEGYNYWGRLDILGAQGSNVLRDPNYGDEQHPNHTWFLDPNVPGGPYVAYSGMVIEGKYPLDKLVDEVCSYPDYVAGNFRNGKVNGLWKVAFRVATNLSGGYYKDFAPMFYLPVIADGNDDGQVNLLDFQLIQSGYNKTFAVPDSWERGDFNLDGKVDLLDFQFLQVTYLKNVYTMGPGGASGAVPEPITLVLVGLGGLLACRRR